MAIDQGRMIDLIDAGLDHQQALNLLCQRIHDLNIDEQFILDENTADIDTLRHAYSNLKSIFLILKTDARPTNLLRNAVKSSVVLSKESIHFKKNYNRNVREATKAAQRRAGITPTPAQHPSLPRYDRNKLPCPWCGAPIDFTNKERRKYDMGYCPECTQGYYFDTISHISQCTPDKIWEVAEMAARE